MATTLQGALTCTSTSLLLSLLSLCRLVPVQATSGIGIAEEEANEEACSPLPFPPSLLLPVGRLPA